MLSELSAHTVDHQGNRAFIPAKHLTKILKSATLRQFSIYFDPDADFFTPSIAWNVLSPAEWDEYFLVPILNERRPESIYFLHPVNGILRFQQNRHVCGHQWKESEPTRLVEISLKEVNATLSRRQYEHLQSLLTVIDMYQVSSNSTTVFEKTFLETIDLLFFKTSMSSERYTSSPVVVELCLFINQTAIQNCTQMGVE